MRRGRVRRGRDWSRLVDLLTGFGALLILGALLSRTALALSPPPDPPRDEDGRVVDLGYLPDVLDYGDLPGAFTYSGLTWRAAATVRIGPMTPVEQMDWIAGYRLFHRYGDPRQPFRRLYMPVPGIGRSHRLYVRYDVVVRTAGVPPSVGDGATRAGLRNMRANLPNERAGR